MSTVLAMVSFAPIFVGLVLFAALAVFVVVAASKKESNSDTPDYETVALVSPAERSFFDVLQQAVAADYLILVKVRVADIIHPAREISRSGWRKAFNRIAGKHVDFVICERESLQVLGAIELDDRSHQALDRGIRDRLIDSALANARIPVLRIPAQRSYSPAEIRMHVEGLVTMQPAQLAPSDTTSRDARERAESKQRAREQRAESLPHGRPSAV
ncbi:MAG TPA: DUF2726 domain-containing protein [Verrucomicrobiae bacterium]